MFQGWITYIQAQRKKVLTSSLDNKYSARVAVLTEIEDRHQSPIFPKIRAENGRKWDYYDLCLKSFCHLKYFEYKQWKKITSYDYVFVHETLYETHDQHVVDILSFLKEKNGNIYWVELHEKSLYSGAVFLEGFIECVDLILKHQVTDFAFLKQSLSCQPSNLAPFYFFGKPNILEYWQERSYFGFKIDQSLIEKHITFDFEALQDLIKVIMYPFSWKMIMNGFPSYSSKNVKTKLIGHAGRVSINHAQRNAIAAALVNAGINVSFCDNYFQALRESKFFMGIGHIHSSLRTFDTMAYDTVLIHYESFPYKLWAEFEEYVTFLPFGNPHKLFLEGGFGFDEEYFRKIVNQLQNDIENEALIDKILENQKSLFYKLVNPAFICKKIGINLGKNNS